MTNPPLFNRVGRVTLAGLALSAAIAHAQQAPLVFSVNTVADLIDENVNDGVCRSNANTCSLRAAVMQANHLTAPGVLFINLPAGTYRLTRAPGAGADETHGDLDLLAPAGAGQGVVINGEAASNTIIDANQSDRALSIGPGRSAGIVNATIRNGNSDSGGGINISSGTLSISDCVIEGNRAENSGGGIYQVNGSLSMIRCTVRSNLAGDDGGGLFLGGAATIRNSTISGNGANEGGGLRISALVNIVSSTISQNYADTDGGGIYNADTTRLYSSSVINNDADHDRDQNGGIGGGIFNRSGRSVAVINTLVVDNTIRDAPIFNDCQGTLNADGLSLFSDVGGCTLTGGWNVVPQGTIGPLQNNGGPTRTHALNPDSAAIDSTNDALRCVDESGTLLMFDQRGAARVAGVRCDVGAVEYGALVDLIFKDGFQ